MISPKTESYKMGLEWICIDSSNNHYSFKASLLNWPSSTRTEMYAFYTALLVSLHSSSINIFLDSQATIYGFSKYVLNNSLSPRKFEKIPNHSIWLLIKHIVDTLKLSIHLHKVKAHNNDHFNDIADQLAKAGCNTPSLIPILNNIPSSDLIFTFNKVPVEISIRGFFKHLFSAKTFCNFLDLNRNSLIRRHTENHTINWPAIWSLLSLDSSSLVTSFASCKLKTFIIKNFVNELPTLSRISVLRPDLYEHWCCIGCNQATETPAHLWTCNAYSTRIHNVIQITKDDLIHRLTESNASKLTEHLSKLSDVFNDIFVTPSSRTDGYIDIIQSLIPSSLVNVVHKITRNKGRCFSTITQTLLVFHQKLFED